MGARYSSAESESLIQALKNNISIANQIVDRLTNGCKHLIDVLNSGQLSGAAYTAGKGLIEQIIIPAIYKVQDANRDVQADLSSYEYAHSIVTEYGLLDHDDLKKQLSIKKAQVDAINDQLERNNNFFNLIQETVTGDLGNMLAQNQALEYMRDQILEPQIQDIKAKLDKLEWFVSTVNGLFQDCLEAFQLAVQGARSINQISVDSSGNYYTNGADMGWLKKLQGETFDNGAGGLSTKYKNDSKDLKGIMDLAKSMGISPLSAEELYKSINNLNEFNQLMKQIQSTADVTAAYLKSEDPYKKELKEKGEAYVFNWDTLLGNVQYGYVQSENSILKGSFDILESKGKSFGSIGDNYQLGPAWGGSSSYLHIDTSKSDWFGWLSSVDVLKGSLGVGVNPKGSDNACIEGGARASLIEGESKKITFKIPGINKDVSIGISGSVSAGASGHVLSEKGNFSVGGKVGVGPGVGVELQVKDK